MFRCPRCGWQNMIGQRFCESCGEIFQYNCPYCNAFVDPAYSTCASCGAYLTWGFQEQSEAQPVEQGPAYQQQPYQQPYQQQQQPYQQQQVFQQQPHEATVQSGKKADAPTREALKKKRQMNQLIVLGAATGLLICIGIAIYLTVTTFSDESTPSTPSTPAASSGNQTSLKPFDNNIYIVSISTGLPSRY